MIKVAILQRICPQYRTDLFKGLSNSPNIDVKLIIGADIPNTKIKSCSDLSGINYTKVKTIIFYFLKHPFVYHIGLIRELKSFKPDIIICEGESHFLGYVKAIIYRLIFRKETNLIHWCFIDLPGNTNGNVTFRKCIKSLFRKAFQGFLVYSNFSKKRLISYGIDEKKIFVSTNVGNIKNHIYRADSILYTKQEIRELLSLPQNFTVLYLGTLDENKKPFLLLELVKKFELSNVNFLILGSGVLYEKLRENILENNLNNVFLLGRITDKLTEYCKASDVLVIPGRGGIVISEAMAFKLPVIVHEADGTEYDLIENNKSGFIIEHGTHAEFYEKIKFLLNNLKIASEMGEYGRILVEKKYTTENMISQIELAVTSIHYSNIKLN